MAKTKCEGEFGDLCGEDEVTLCKGCNCMTKTIKGKCGKCGAEKGDDGK